MKNRNPLSSLLAMAMIGALLDPALAQQPAAQAKQPQQPAGFPPLDIAGFFGADLASPKEGTTAQQANQPDPARSLEDMLDRIFGAAPGASPLYPLSQTCAIPPDIADRAEMNAPGFDPHSLEGRTVVLLAAALSNLRELSSMKAHSNPAGAAKCAVADGQIGAAIAAINLSNHA